MKRSKFTESQIVFAITQDKEGFMWFGTRDGLNRYDGREIKQYHHDPNDQNTLDDNPITTMHTDATGNLWVGAFNNGLFKVPVKNDVFYHSVHFSDLGTNIKYRNQPINNHSEFPSKEIN